VLFCALGNSQENNPLESSFSYEELCEDYSILVKVMDESHPGIGRFSSSENFVHPDFQELFSSDSSEFTLAESYFKFSEYIDRIEDGHTRILLGEPVHDYLFSKKFFFPFTLKYINDSYYINYNFSEHEYLERGNKVLAIDGVEINDIIHDLLVYINCDGQDEIVEIENLDGEFWWWYGLRYGLKNKHILQYVEENTGNQKNIIVNSLSFSDRYETCSEVYDLNSNPEEIVSYRIQDGIAVLTINGFYGISKRQYKHILKSCFQDIKDYHIEKLVVDLRKNAGGREGFDNLLLAYLDQDITNKYKKVEMKNTRSEYYKFMKNPFKQRMHDWLYRNVEYCKCNEHHFARRNRFARSLNQEQENKFDGETFVIIGSEVFSGASDFAALAKYYVSNCTLVGSETRGSVYGNTSGYYYTFILPNTNFEVVVPRVYFELDVPSPTCERGVQPDVNITMTLNDFLDNKDPQMDFVIGCQ